MKIRLIILSTISIFLFKTKAGPFLSKPKQSEHDISNSIKTFLLCNSRSDNPLPDELVNITLNMFFKSEMENNISMKDFQIIYRFLKQNKISWNNQLYKLVLDNYDYNLTTKNNILAYRNCKQENELSRIFTRESNITLEFLLANRTINVNSAIKRITKKSNFSSFIKKDNQNLQYCVIEQDKSLKILDLINEKIIKTIKINNIKDAILSINNNFLAIITRDDIRFYKIKLINLNNEKIIKEFIIYNLDNSLCDFTKYFFYKEDLFLIKESYSTRILNLKDNFSTVIEHPRRTPTIIADNNRHVSEIKRQFKQYQEIKYFCNETTIEYNTSTNTYKYAAALHVSNTGNYKGEIYNNKIKIISNKSNTSFEVPYKDNIGISFSDNDQYIAIKTSTNNLKIYQTETGELICNLNLEDNINITNAIFANHDNLIAISTTKEINNTELIGKLIIVDITNNQFTSTIQLEQNYVVKEMRFLYDDLALIYRSGKIKCDIKYQNNKVNAISFLPLENAEKLDNSELLTE